MLEDFRANVLNIKNKIKIQVISITLSLMGDCILKAQPLTMEQYFMLELEKIH